MNYNQDRKYLKNLFFIYADTELLLEKKFIYVIAIQKNFPIAIISKHTACPILYSQTFCLTAAKKKKKKDTQFSQRS